MNCAVVTDNMAHMQTLCVLHCCTPEPLACIVIDVAHENYDSLNMSMVAAVMTCPQCGAGAEPDAGSGGAAPAHLPGSRLSPGPLDHAGLPLRAGQDAQPPAGHPCECPLPVQAVLGSRPCLLHACSQAHSRQSPLDLHAVCAQGTEGVSILTQQSTAPAHAILWCRQSLLLHGARPCRVPQNACTDGSHLLEDVLEGKQQCWGSCNLLSADRHACAWLPCRWRPT